MCQKVDLQKLNFHHKWVFKTREFLKDGNTMINSYQTSNGISYLARQTTDMAPVNVNTTVVPTAISNINKSNVVFVKSVAETIKVIQPTVISSIKIH